MKKKKDRGKSESQCKKWAAILANATMGGACKPPGPKVCDNNEWPSTLEHCDTCGATHVAWTNYMKLFAPSLILEMAYNKFKIKTERLVLSRQFSFM